MAKTWAETLKQNPALLDKNPAQLEREKRKWFYQTVGSTQEYKSLPKEGKQALIASMLEDNTAGAMLRAREEKAKRETLRADLAKAPNLPLGSKRNLINQRLGIGSTEQPKVVTNPIEAAGLEFSRQYMDDTTGGGAIKGVQRATGQPIAEQEDFITEGPLANVGGFLGGLAAQAVDPLNALPVAKGAGVVLDQGLATAAKTAAHAAVPAAKVGAAAGSLGSGLRQYGETGEVDLGQVAADTVTGAALGGVLGAAGGGLAAGTPRRTTPKPLPVPDAPPAIQPDAPQAPPKNILRELVADESGQAVPVSPREAWDNIGNLADHTAGAVTDLAARAGNAALRPIAGRDVLQGGFDPVRNEDRLARQAVDLVNFVAFKAGKDHPYWGPILRKARWLALPDANLPDGFIQTRAAREAQSRQQANRLLGKAHEYESLTPAEREARYIAQAEESAIPTRDAESQDLATTIDDISGQMRDVGAIAPEQYNATRNRYLKRTYDGLAGQEPIPAKLLRRAMKVLDGSQSRGRTKPIRVADIGSQFQPAGTRPDGKPLIQDTTTGEVWVEMGRSQNGETIKAWRDYTFDERTQMGEVRDIVPALQATAKDIQKGLNNGGLLADIAANPDWAVSRAAVEAGTAQRPQGWVLVDNKENASGMPKWGRLANHYVDPDIYEHLVSAYQLNKLFGQMGKVIGMPFFKKNVTVRNYASWVNNIMQETVGITLGGGNPFDVPEAMMILRERGPRFQQYEALGLFDNAALAADIGQRAGGTMSMPNVFRRLLDYGRRIDQFHTDVYQGIGDAFRLAHVLSYERRGMPVEMAIERARNNTYTADIKSPLMDGAANLGIPFIKASYYVTTKIPEMAMLNPGRAALAIGAWNLYHKAYQAYTGESDAEMKAREQLVAEHLRTSGGFVPLPGPNRGPMRDSLGQPLILSTKNWLPLSTFDTTGDTAMAGQYPNALMPGGPLWTLAQKYANYNTQTKQPIVDAARPEPEWEQMLRFTLSQLGPSTLTYHLPKLEAALQGKPTMSGTRYDVPTAALNVVGVKAQPYDAQTAYEKLQRSYTYKIMDIQDSIRREARNHGQGKINDDVFNQRREQLLEKQRRIIEERDRALERAAPGVPQ